VGVKIYPPMGYFPYGNEWRPVSSHKRRPDKSELDRRLLALYRKCIDLDVVVMAHAGESMGRDNAHDELGGAPGWTDALAQPGVGGFGVTAGHCGGDSNKARQSWTRQFTSLMSTAPASRLHADLGYWIDLRDPNLPARERLQRALAAPIGAGRTASERVMFGSDWFMLSQEDDWADYPGDV